MGGAGVVYVYMQTGFKESVAVIFGAILIFCIDMTITSIIMGLMI